MRLPALPEKSGSATPSCSTSPWGAAEPACSQAQILKALHIDAGKLPSCCILPSWVVPGS